MRDKVATILLTIIIACSGVFGYIYGVESIEQETITVTEYVEVPVIVTDTVTVVETVEVPTPYPVYVNHTKIIEIRVPTPMELKDFPSKASLLIFIWGDTTDEIEYSTDFDCDDYALRTINNAAYNGYRVYFFYERTGSESAHAMVMAYVIKEAKYIIWEPQTDKIWAEWSSTVGG